MKVIFLNGPPRSGKDESAKVVSQNFLNFYRVGFADYVKNTTHAIYGLNDIAYDHFEMAKDQPSDLLRGVTPRQAYITFSENYMKPLHGKSVFGRVLADSLDRSKNYAISDSGFADEAMPVIGKAGAENCLLIRFSRPGCSFASDSRSYIDLPIKTINIDNGSTLLEFHDTVFGIVDAWLNPED